MGRRVGRKEVCAEQRAVTGQRIREVRLKAGERQTDFAKVIGVTGSQVSCWEIGKQMPSIVCLIAISLSYDVSIDWLLGLEGENKDG